jgi:hypothetical protein
MLTRRQLFVISLVVASLAAALALDNGLALYTIPPQREFLFLFLTQTPETALFYFIILLF